MLFYRPPVKATFFGQVTQGENGQGKYFKNIYTFLLEGGRQKESENPKQTPCPAREPDVGLDLTTLR